MMTLFEKAGYATDPSALRGTFGVNVHRGVGRRAPLIVMRCQATQECSHEASRGEMDV